MLFSNIFKTKRVFEKFPCFVQSQKVVYDSESLFLIIYT